MRLVTCLFPAAALAAPLLGDPARGEALWTETYPAPDGGPARACTSCHGKTLAARGAHATTGEPIAPMSEPGRYSDPAKVEKWFGRNCRWTLGRDCTPQEKADFLAYLTGAR
jgi:hypothetical protein